jgi:hypothetical protein
MVGAAKYRRGPEATEATATAKVMVLAVVASVAVASVAVLEYGHLPFECALAATRSSTITVASFNAYKYQLSW